MQLLGPEMSENPQGATDGASVGRNVDRRLV